MALPKKKCRRAVRQAAKKVIESGGDPVLQYGHCGPVRALSSPEPEISANGREIRSARRAEHRTTTGEIDMFASCRCHTAPSEHRHQFGRRHRTTAARAAQEKRLRFEPLEVRCLLSVSYGGGTSSSSQTQSAGVYAQALVVRPAVSQQPTVTSISPAVGSAQGGTAVTINGSGFTGATAVSFGGTPATAFTVVSDGQITATSPQGLGKVDVMVTTPGGTSAASTADQFTYQMNLVVTTLVDKLDANYDPNDLSLRDALALTNSNAGGENTITFATGLSGGTIHLSFGELAIVDSVDIANTNAASITIDAGGGSRIFDINDGDSNNASNVEIENLTLSGGSADNGGAIYSSENLSLTSVTISGNIASGDGGGIYATDGGQTSLTKCTVAGNTASGNGGGIYANTAAGSGLTIDDCTITQNSLLASNIPDSGNGGGLAAGGSGSVNIQGSTFSANQVPAPGNGGGLEVGTSGPFTMQQSTVTGNSSSRGVPTSGGDGGGICLSVSASASSISDCTISQNYEWAGGGFWITTSHTGELTVQGCVISGNSPADLTTAWGGGGGWIETYDGGTTAIENCTITGNTVPTGFGGGLFVWTQTTGTTVIEGCTVSGNSSQEGGGALIFTPRPPGTPGRRRSSRIAPSRETRPAKAAAGFTSMLGMTLAAPPASKTARLPETRPTPAPRPTSTAVESTPGFGTTTSRSSWPALLLLAMPIGTRPRRHRICTRPVPVCSISGCSLIGDSTGSGLTEAPVGSPDSNGNLIGGPIHGVIDPKLGPPAKNGGPTETCPCCRVARPSTPAPIPPISSTTNVAPVIRACWDPRPTWEPMV